MIKKDMLGLVAVLVSLIVLSWDWVVYTLAEFAPLKRFLIAAAFTVLIFGALAWSLGPIVWDWAAYLGLI